MTALGLTVESQAVDSLLAYQALLLKWNAAINLTAVRDPAQMLVQHLLDSLSVLAPFEQRLATASPRILDVGSGGGLPGIVLAIMRPAWNVTCVDAVGKKVTFIRQVAAELRLNNLQAQHMRIEAYRPTAGTGRRPDAPPFDLITSRAFASLDDFTRLTAHLGAGDDQPVLWAAMKGKVPEQEMAALPAPFTVFHVEQLKVPDLDADRCLVWIRSTGA